jgi:hypothetical protein
MVLPLGFDPFRVDVSFPAGRFKRRAAVRA